MDYNMDWKQNNDYCPHLQKNILVTVTFKMLRITSEFSLGLILDPLSSIVDLCFTVQHKPNIYENISITLTLGVSLYYWIHFLILSGHLSMISPAAEMDNGTLWRLCTKVKVNSISYVCFSNFNMKYTCSVFLQIKM